MTNLVQAVLLVFYLYLVVRWQHVRRPTWYLVGVCGLLFGMFGGFFEPVSKGAAAVFAVFGTMVGFASAVVACYAEKLPIGIPGVEEAPRPPMPPTP